MPEDVRYDVLNALKNGQTQKEKFICNLLIGKEVPFFEPIKRNKFKALSSTTPKRQLVASNQKVIQYKATSGFIFQIFIKSQLLWSQINISELMSYPLTVTPYSISTVDGIFAKNNKAQGMNLMIKDAENVELPSASQCGLVVDGNATFYMSNVPQTVKTISERIIKSQRPEAEMVFSTDTYVDRLHSPKSAERDHCGERFGPRVKRVDEAREIKVQKMCGSSLELHPGLSIDFSTFPPCRRVLIQHIKRVNVQVCIWKRAHENNPAIPSPLGIGFHLNTENGKLEPLWFEGDVIPKALNDVLVEEWTDEDDLEEIHTYMNDDEEEEEDEYDD
ncbi:hypothetical protein XNOV1_A042672 [Xyrichtys novacula]|uniref:Uncharacterized protein n=1 Tax=Xyrichtys novacula TaxID=13765 RepID=A0AAV1H2Z3_XYRNO|nr:hypothetical protein XNOV1_A042672 [Xyrichtys novacula]